jgi:predicted nucleic acid-binding protein
MRLRQSTRNVLVVDASVLAPVVGDSGSDGLRFRNRLRGEAAVGPDLLRVEVASVLRRHAHTGHLTPAQADAAFDDLLDFPIRVFPTGPLLRRVWELRKNLTTYDGCYVALAEAVDSTLLTADRRLANAPGLRCSVEVL